MKRIRTLIVHAKPEIRALLREMLAGEKDLELLGEFTDGLSGARALRKHQPQLLFLGVRLPGMDGFDVLKAANHHAPPVVIFASPYEQYAVRAFDVHAVDYLLKPFTRERFQKAVARARTRISRNHQLSRTGPEPQLIGVKSGRNIVLLRPTEIHSIVSTGRQCTVTADGQAFSARTTLQNFRRKLPADFVRVNRSTLINAGQVRSITRKSHGDALVQLAGGGEFPLSRRYRAEWSRLLGSCPL